MLYSRVYPSFRDGHSRELRPRVLNVSNLFPDTSLSIKHLTMGQLALIKATEHEYILVSKLTQRLEGINRGLGRAMSIDRVCGGAG